MRSSILLPLTFGLAIAAPSKWPGKGHGHKINVQLGPRPYYLVNDMDEGTLKKKLESCSEGPFYTNKFTIGHRGSRSQAPQP
jgi:glycerophosphoryl diester phosphodiesterase